MFDNLPHYLYFVVMALVVIGWLALIVFPRQTWANYWFSGIVIPSILCAIYMFLLLVFWFRPPAARITEFFTLEGVYTMFGNRGLLLVAWINLITMDLVVGAWMTRKAAQIRMPYIFLLPGLVLTFVFAGFGFTWYVMVAGLHGRVAEIAKFEGQPPPNTAPVFARPTAPSIE